jgi:hypothetical protein
MGVTIYQVRERPTANGTINGIEMYFDGYQWAIKEKSFLSSFRNN